MERVYLSKEGYQKFCEELEYLKNSKRKEIAQAMAHARSLGDLSENAEFDAAKEALEQNEIRIRDLEDRLSRVEIVDDVKIDASKAYVGATVTLIDLETHDSLEYRLVGTDEADPIQGFISVTSPVGKSLLGHAVGDIVEIVVPAGTLQYRVEKISR